MELLTRKQAACYLKLSLRKLDSLAAGGEIRRIKLGKGPRARVLFRQEDLDAYVEQHLLPANSDFEREAARILGAGR